MKLTNDYLKSTCRLGDGPPCCRYLIGTPDGFECGKHSNLRGTIDARFSAGTMVAQGDNCRGFPEETPS